MIIVPRIKTDYVVEGPIENLHVRDMDMRDVQWVLRNNPDSKFSEFQFRYPCPFGEFGKRLFIPDEDLLYFSDEEAEADDYHNLAVLLRAGIELAVLINKSDKEDISFFDFHTFNSKFGTMYSEADADDSASLSLAVPLRNSAMTKRYIDYVGAVVGPVFSLDHEMTDDKDAALTLNFDSRGAGTNRKEPSWRMKALEKIFESFTQFMLVDCSFSFVDKQLTVNANSTIASLWSAVLNAYNTGEAKTCDVCGQPFISHGSRGKKAEYCSPACTKMHQRLEAYYHYINNENLSEEEAASKAKVSLKRAQEYWTTKLN